MSFQLPADARSAAKSLSAGSSSAASPSSATSVSIAWPSSSATCVSAPNATGSSENGSSTAPHACNRPSKRRKTRKARETNGVRGGRRRVRTSALKKIIKNAREKKRVRIVRILYEDLLMVLKGQVERGSGHFSKVRALAGAIRHIEKLMEKVKCLANQTMKNALSSLHGPQLEVGPCSEIVTDMSPLEEDEKDLTGVGAEVNLSEINLSCGESLDPVPEKLENSQPAPLPRPPPLLPIPFQLQEEVPYSSLLPTTPYFSYNGGGVATSDFPPPLGCFTCPPNGTNSSGTSSSSSNMGLPPSSSSSSSSSTASSLYSPELSTTPPPYSHHCGQDVWLAIGCN